jgi:hypothetical protein
MTASLRAFYPEAEHGRAAQAHVAQRVELIDSLIVDRDSLDALDALGLDEDAIADSAEQLSAGGCLLVLLVADRERLAELREALDDFTCERSITEEPDSEADQPVLGAARPSAPELRIGAPVVIRAGATVSAQLDPPPSPPQEQPPAPEAISEDDIVAAELLAERVLEFAETREEAVVSRSTFVREELVVRKSVEERVERIAGTVRQTEVETERLGPRPRSTLVRLDSPEAASPREAEPERL